ncbi:peptidase domain-containing ABC transporter [Pragia fontium]|uniref:ATP-binding cassette, subfamily B, RaxB n=1 Tax=Pragia fontium DSM 5563 = ATCC 49100 TaxID=1122977 RepID=A0AAJ4WAR5_9GAMM|nr:peptidase domain-containing ABC transporter [Pragia fontium]SFC85745.1 ATP-binding cassette, subfamily B, RaxB [Pragia fontium DSM 5563 = ATCC 49100]VEJ56126.1 Lactococcin-G-processing and transport ATP-binding protein LagD [Pragia fontium]
MNFSWPGSLTSPHQVPLILQHEYTECGLACLAMVMGAYGHRTTLSELRREYPISLEGGTSIADLAEFAITKGMTPRLLQGEIEDVPQLTFPVIAFWRNSHFVVITEATSSTLCVHDPILGEQQYTLEEARALFSQYVLELRPTTSFKKRQPSDALKMGTLISWVNEHGKNQIILLMLMFFGLLLLLAVPSYVQLVIDQAIQKSDFDLAILLTCIFSMVFLFQAMTQLLRTLLEVVARNLSYDQLSQTAWRHNLSLGLSYFQRRPLGTVLAIDKSLEACSEFISNGYAKLIYSIVMALISLICMFLYNVEMAAWTLLLMSIFFLIRYALIRPFRRAVDKEIAESAQYESLLAETHEGIACIKSSAIEAGRGAVLDKAMRRSVEARIRKDQLTAKFNAGSMMVVNAEQLLVVCLGAWMVIQGEISIGMLYAYLSYKQYFADSTVDVAEGLLHKAALEAPLSRISDMMATESEAKSFGNKRCPHPLQQIELNNLFFAYPNRALILDDISTVWHRKQEVVLVGPSGSGKTTLLRMLNAMLSPTSGDIFYDGINQKEITPESLRKHVRVIHADEHVFSGTILENISGFSYQPDLSRVKEVCRIAEIAEVVELLSHGYETEIMPGDSYLSAGEKQRLVLARALYHQPDFLLCDELTANMDQKTAHKILHNLRELDLGLIFITHTPEQVYQQGALYILQQGKLIEIDEPKRYLQQQS